MITLSWRRIRPIAYHVCAFIAIFLMFALPWKLYFPFLLYFMIPAVFCTLLITATTAVFSKDTRAGIRIGMFIGFLVDLAIFSSAGWLSESLALSFPKVFVSVSLIWLCAYLFGEIDLERMETETNRIKREKGLR